MLTGNYKPQMIMANKRSLKHAIKLVCTELFAEAVAASLYGNEPQKEKSHADTVLASIVRLESDYIRRISHIEPGMKPKLYFKILRERFANEVDEIVDQINCL